MLGNLGYAELLMLFIVVCLFFGFYFLPTIIGYFREKKLLPIFLINLFTGWICIGWFLALWLVLRKES
ncbi:superinfection immunity protein [Leptospira wolffii]|uniref:superinfection immunity protein n=1 Tax=Leptospira wolffii TaxID=409998 RepID=UPI00058E574C|nr:superinfection immunity protein [Leptospira wolffii]